MTAALQPLTPDALRIPGRVVLMPAGLPSAAAIWDPLCARLGLHREEYAIPEAGHTRAFLAHALGREPALLVVPVSLRIGAENFAGQPGAVGALASVSTGTDHVQLAWLAEQGVPFLHAPGANAESVAQYVISVLGRVVAEERLLAAGARVGIVGYGRIGQRLGAWLERLGIPHSYHDPFVPAIGSRTSQALSAVLAQDVVSFHVPLTEDGPHRTRDMLNEESLAAVRAGTVLINTARGPVFSRAACQAAAACGPLVLDVFPQEPPDAELLAWPRLVTPHVAGYGYAARAGGVRRVALAFVEWLVRSEVIPAEGAAELVPPLEEVSCPIDVLTFFENEDRFLRQTPTAFTRHRQFYPPRAGLRQLARAGCRGSAWVQKILAAARED